MHHQSYKCGIETYSHLLGRGRSYRPTLSLSFQVHTTPFVWLNSKLYLYPTVTVRACSNHHFLHSWWTWPHHTWCPIPHINLPLTKAASIVLQLIGIANTHTLTSSSSLNAFLPSSNMQMIHFALYTSVQLQEILQSHWLLSCKMRIWLLMSRSSFQTPLLCSWWRKVAALTGDVHSLFEVLWGAIDLAIAPHYCLSAFKIAVV